MHSQAAATGEPAVQIENSFAVDAPTDRVYAFLLEASPQPFSGATGSPVNPVAVK